MLGFASIGGLVGTVAGAYLGAIALGMGVPDDAEYLPFVMMVCAGGGWLVGTGIGSIASARARPGGPTARRLVLVGAAAVAIGTAAIAISPVSGWPDGSVTFFSPWRAGGGGIAFEIATMVNAVLAVVTFLAVSREHRNHDGGGFGRPPRVVGAVGITGLLLGGLAFGLGVALVYASGAQKTEHLQMRVVTRTTAGLVRAVSEHVERTGSFPANLAEVRATDKKVRPGTQVEFAGVVDGSFCIRVGVDVGEERADDPHYSALVHRRPLGSNAWTSARTWLGNSCTRSQ